MMEIADEITLPAPRAGVYAALNDIAILKACIPGCESLERESDTKLVAKVTLKIGPVYITRKCIDTEPIKEDNFTYHTSKLL